MTNDFDDDDDYSRLADQESIAQCMAEYAGQHRTEDASPHWLFFMPHADRFLSAFEAAGGRHPVDWEEICIWSVRHKTTPRFVTALSGGKQS